MEAKDSSFIDEMTRMITRPRRDVYHPERLGPAQLIVKAKALRNKTEKHHSQYIEVSRKDSTVDVKGQQVKLSYYSSLERQHKQDAPHPPPRSRDSCTQKKCVVYLHANSGSRVEGLEIVRYVLPLGWNLALFDYRGSGISDGESTSMGLTESEDLMHILQFLRQNQQITQFSLWGRSMGAVTILYYLLKQETNSKSKPKMPIKAVVLDSPFSSLKKLMFEIGSSTIHLPQFVLLPIVSSIGDKLTEKFGVQVLQQLDLIDNVKKLRSSHPSCSLFRQIHALFLTSTEDKLVNAYHVEELYKDFPFEQKQLYYYNGQHNDVRSDAVKTKCSAFLCEYNDNSKVEVEEELERKQLGSPLIKRSELLAKMGKLNLEEDKRETQFLLPPPNKKSSINSPKFQKTKAVEMNTSKSRNPLQQKSSKLIDVQTQKSTKHLNSTCSQANVSQHQAHFMHKSAHPQPHHANFQGQYSEHQNSLPPPPSIIINHNYNVSVNVFDGNRSLELQHQQIPPINFNQPGHMTDRISEHPLPGNRYYIPYTAKVQRRNYGGMAQSWSNTFEDSGLSSSVVFGNAGKSNIVRPSNLQSSIDSHHLSQQLSGFHKNLEIPLIRFEGIDYDSRREEPNSSSGLKYRENVDKIKSSAEIKMNVGSPAERQKMSLTEIRKIQREEQQRCVMKSSKIISVKDKQQQQNISQDFQKLNLKKQALMQSESWKDRSQEGERGKLRSMKTSLMVRRKGADRKSSDSISGTMKSFIENRQGITQNSTVGLSSMGRPSVFSPKAEEQNKK